MSHVCLASHTTIYVAIEGFVVYIGRDISCTLNVVLLVQYVSRRVVM